MNGSSILNDLISKTEKIKFNPITFSLFFLATAFLRNYTEGIIGASRTIGTSLAHDTALFQMGVLFNLEWIALFLSIVVVVSFISKIPILFVLKTSVLFFPLIITVPFIDLLLNFPSGCHIDYIYSLNGYINALLTFFIPWKDAGVCPGIRVEVFMAFLITGIYVYFKTNSFIKTFACSLSVYFLAVSSMAFPVFISVPAFPFFSDYKELINIIFFSKSINSPLINRVALMISFYLIPVIFSAVFIYYGKENTLKIFKNLNFSDSFLTFSCLLAGFIASGASFQLNPLFYSVQLLISLIILLIVLNFKNINKKILFPLFLLVLIISSSVSVPFLFTVIFLMSTLQFLGILIGQKLLHEKTNFLYKFIFFPAAYISGHAVSLSAPYFSLSKTMICLFIFLAVYFNYMSFKDNLLGKFFIIFLYGMTSVFFQKNLFMYSSLAVLSIILIFTAKNKNYRQHFLNTILSFIILLSAI